MKVSEVMTRDVQTVRPDQTAREAANFMQFPEGMPVIFAEAPDLARLVPADAP